MELPYGLSRRDGFFGTAAFLIAFEDFWQIYNIYTFMLQDNPTKIRQVFPDPLIYITLSLVGVVVISYIYFKGE